MLSHFTTILSDAYVNYASRLRESCCLLRLQHLRHGTILRSLQLPVHCENGRQSAGTFFFQLSPLSVILQSFSFSNIARAVVTNHVQLPFRIVCFHRLSWEGNLEVLRPSRSCEAIRNSVSCCYRDLSSFSLSCYSQLYSFGTFTTKNSHPLSRPRSFICQRSTGVF